MSAVISLNGRAAGYHPWPAFLTARSAVSREAVAVHNATAAAAEAGESSFALFGHKAAAISRLRELETECGDEGWDGYDATPILAVAILKAQALLRALPPRIPLPEFAVDPDGSVSLDWISSRHRLFSLSVDAENRVAFAWVDGTNSGHGVESFDGISVPRRILEGIEMTVGIERAALWTA